MYYANTKLIADSVSAIILAWYNYSPDMAEAGITIGEEKDVALRPTVYSWTKETIAKLDLPPELQSYKQSENKEKSGCLSIMLLMITWSTSLMELAYLGISHYLT